MIKNNFIFVYSKEREQFEYFKKPCLAMLGGMAKAGTIPSNMCNTRILCQTARTTVSQCTECGMFFIWHHNILLNFKQKEFYLFLTHIKKYVFQQRSICFPDGEYRLLMHSAAEEISMAFTEEEWEDIKEVLTEAAYLANVYAILKGTP